MHRELLLPSPLSFPPSDVTFRLRRGTTDRVPAAQATTAHSPFDLTIRVHGTDTTVSGWGFPDRRIMRCARPQPRPRGQSPLRFCLLPRQRPCRHTQSTPPYRSEPYRSGTDLARTVESSNTR